jgi:phospholipid/cholesterol/gamma-HCH transport system ATP-binding protein
MQQENAIEIIDLKKAFVEDDYVLNGINLQIPKGKITVIIGFSGTGKSVLLKHILGLLKPTSGTIKILGQDISSMPEEEMIAARKHFGVLFQYAALFDDMSVLDNVRFPLNEHRKDLSKSQIKAIAYEKLKQAGLDEKHYNKLPGEVSGGMRKRCGLARALALDPDILVYDEPTTGLDPVLTEMVDDLILSTHNRKEDTASLVVSHDLYAAFRIGDYVAMLDSGKVLLHGPPKVFLESDNPLVSRFVTKGVNKK